MTPLSAVTIEVDAGEAPARAERLRGGPRRVGWLREPLLHFVLLGGLLFAFDHVLASRADDPLAIVVSAKVDRQATDTFSATRGREPNEEELEALRRVWLDNEVLYREGLALGVDKGDEAIRERVIFKALSVIDSNVKVPTIDDAELRGWFESRRSKYDEPARYDFDEAVLTGGNSEAPVRAFVQRLNSGAPGELEAQLRVFKDRPQPSLAQSYGAEFAAALEKSPPGKWQALPAGKGWRAIRLAKATPPKVADYAALRGIVLQDWTDAIASEQRTAAVRALEKKYHVEYEKTD